MILHILNYSETTTQHAQSFIIKLNYDYITRINYRKIVEV